MRGQLVDHSLLGMLESSSDGQEEVTGDRDLLECQESPHKAYPKNYIGKYRWRMEITSPLECTNHTSYELGL